MNNIIMAWRARAKKRGYKEIHIKKQKGGYIYNITAIEPLGGNYITAQLTIEAMQHEFR